MSYPRRYREPHEFCPEDHSYCVILSQCRTPILIDSDNYERFSRIAWFISIKGYVFSPDAKEFGYHDASMHQIVAETPDGMATDHRDHNLLNNRRANLRHATRANNCQNRVASNWTGYKGISQLRDQDRWTATIQADGVRHYLGIFPTAELAACAYNSAAKEYHGEFAWLNVLPTDGSRIMPRFRIKPPDPIPENTMVPFALCPYQGCGEPVIRTCLCPKHDQQCVRGHEWHQVMRHGKVIVHKGTGHEYHGRCECDRLKCGTFTTSRPRPVSQGCALDLQKTVETLRCRGQVEIYLDPSPANLEGAMQYIRHEIATIGTHRLTAKTTRLTMTLFLRPKTDNQLQPPQAKKGKNPSHAPSRRITGVWRADPS